MSFSSIFSIAKKIGSTLYGVERTLAPVASLAFPQFAVVDSFVTKIHDLIITAEANNPLEKQGPAKSTAVMTDFVAGLSVAQEILALKGQTLTFDQDALRFAIAAQVEAFNQMARLKASFQITPAAGPSTPPPSGVFSGAVQGIPNFGGPAPQISSPLGSTLSLISK